MSRQLTEEELQDLYAWIDKISLSRPKRHISRDFSDGVMAAEVVKYFFPKLVDLHNYAPASSTPQKLSNWDHLNRKVFSKLNFHLPEETVRKLALSTAGAIEPVLSALREKIDKKLEQSSDALLMCADLEFFDTRNQEGPPAELCQTDLAQLRGEEMENNNEGRQRISNPQYTAQLYKDMDQRFRTILQEKEQTALALQKTVEILQMKVSRLVQLVHLKDLHIEELTQHLKTHNGKAKPR